MNTTEEVDDTAPYEVAFAVPLPKIMYANKIPIPGPGFDSIANKID